MTEKFTKYPLAWRAFEEMKASYADVAAEPGYQMSLAIKERSLEILESYLDGSAQRKEDLMATAAILQRNGTVFGMDASSLETDYNPHVYALILEVQQGINERKGGGASENILQVTTAIQIATHEYMIQAATPETAAQWSPFLKKYRDFRDQGAYGELADTRMQKKEVAIYNTLMATLDELSGKTQPGSPTPPKSGPSVLH